MSRKYLKFSVGPVQGFISESRQMRDYWSSSFLISWLSAGAAGLVKHESRSIKAFIPSTQDPMVGAVLRNLGVEGFQKTEPFFGTFSNVFACNDTCLPEIHELQDAVNQRWHTLAHAVFDRIFSGHEFDNEREALRRIWDAQIGTENDSLHPFLETMITVSKKNVDGGLLKSQRMGSDITRFDKLCVQDGFYCSLMNGWREISPYLTNSQEDRNKRKAFWAKVQNVLLVMRYGQHTASKNGMLREFDDDGYVVASSAGTCIDLRDNERLCAPALIKRAFPLLDLGLEERSIVKDVIGWVPRYPGAVVYSRQKDGKFGTFLKKTLELFKPGAASADLSDREQNPDAEDRELPHWPSVSHIASASWIALVQRHNLNEAGKFAQEAYNISPRYVRNKMPIWFEKTKPQTETDGESVKSLVQVDATLFHKDRLTRALEISGKDPDHSIVQILDDIAHTDVTEDKLPREKLGLAPQVYAILRMDADNVGNLMADSTINSKFSEGIGKFIDDVRGDLTRADPFGLAYKHNALLVFLGGDELMAMMPVEEALPLACTLQKAYGEHVKDIGKKAGISASISYVDVRTPLWFAIEKTTERLDKVAKSDIKNRLAMGIVGLNDTSTSLVLPWSAHADGKDISPAFMLKSLVETVAHELPAMGSNVVFHKIVNRLAPYMDQEGKDPSVADMSLAQRLLAAELYNQDQIKSRASEMAKKLMILGMKYGVNINAEGNAYSLNRRSTFNPQLLEIIRLLTANWLKPPKQTEGEQ